MFDIHRAKVIDGIEHRGDVPRPRGRLLELVDRCPLWLSILVLFVLIALEMLGFAVLYHLISESSIEDCLDYSLFSALGETVPGRVKNAVIIDRIIPVQSIMTNCLISFCMAIVLYKLINARPMLIKIENHVVFDPTTGTLRLRIVNSSNFTITNVRVNASFRLHIPNGGRHATANLRLKRDTVDIFRPYVVWNVATKPFVPGSEDAARLDIERYDKDRIYEFIPDMLNEGYRSDDPELAKRLDYRNLDVTFTVKSPLFGTDWVYQKSFSAKDFVCGKLISLDPHTPGKEIMDWSNWGRYDDMSESYCKSCVFAGHCGIVKKHQRHTLIN